MHISNGSRGHQVHAVGLRVGHNGRKPSIRRGKVGGHEIVIRQVAGIVVTHGARSADVMVPDHISQGGCVHEAIECGGC